MSITAIGWAYQQQLPPGPKFVLVSLANYASEDGVCWPSIGTIARMTGSSSRSVHRSLAKLEAAGLIRRRARWRGADRGQTSNLYDLVGFTDAFASSTPPPDTVSAPP